MQGLEANPIYKSKIGFSSLYGIFQIGAYKYTSWVLSSGITTVQADKISTPDYEPTLTRTEDQSSY